MSYFDSRSFRYLMRGARSGFAQPARVFDWYKTQQSKSPYWTNMFLLFGAMTMTQVVGKGVERSVCYSHTEPDLSVIHSAKMSRQ